MNSIRNFLYILQKLNSREDKVQINTMQDVACKVRLETYFTSSLIYFIPHSTQPDQMNNVVDVQCDGLSIVCKVLREIFIVGLVRLKYIFILKFSDDNLLCDYRAVPAPPGPSPAVWAASWPSLQVTCISQGG